MGHIHTKVGVGNHRELKTYPKGIPNLCLQSDLFIYNLQGLQRILISQIYLWNKILHVSDSSSVYHQEFFHCTHSNGICHTARKLSANMYDIHHCCVYSEKTPDDRQRNCPKHVEFYSKNKFEKLVHLVGFIIRIYHDARSR